MDRVSPRVRRRIERDFPEPGSAQEIVRMVSEVRDSERVQAAVLLVAARDLDRLRQAIDLANADWRDVLCIAGLENEDWSQKLDAEFGPPGGASA